MGGYVRNRRNVIGKREGTTLEIWDRQESETDIDIKAGQSRETVY
jgi:hypothetical protein